MTEADNYCNKAPIYVQVEEKKVSNKVKTKLKARDKTRSLDSHLDDQFATGRLYACISSRPGQCGRCDGYILEGKELEFYQRRLLRKKGKVAGL
jgi:small subunit ribosomal protein S8e